MRPRPMRPLSLASFVVGALLLAAPACGDDPVAYSEVVSLKLSGMKNGDFTNGTVSEDKSISTESGNPYAVFLRNAKDALGGKDPGEIEVVGVTVQVHADSKNVTTVDAVLTDLEVFIATNETTIPVAKKTAPVGSSVAIPLLEDVDYGGVRAKLISGDFKMGARGTGVDPLPSDFDLKLTLDVRFEAYE
jgi:hypothetical protein